MASDPVYEFPERPVSIDEALDIRNQVPSFEHTAPLFGLEAVETGQAGEEQAVVGMYVGFGGGAHLFGFDPEDENWKSVHTVPATDLPEGMKRATEVLVEWLERQYPDEKFALYDRVNPRRN